MKELLLLLLLVVAAAIGWGVFRKNAPPQLAADVAALPHCLKNAPLVPDALTDQYPYGLPAVGRAQVFVPSDADPALRIISQRMFGVGGAFICRPVAIVGDQHILIRPRDVAQAVVLSVQAGNCAM